MKDYLLYVRMPQRPDDLLPFQGESMETVEEINHGNYGFGHHQNANKISVLKFGEPGEPAHRIGGMINLKSYLERITRRMRSGLLDIKQIVIDVE